MITEVAIRNFRALGEVRVQLRPLTVLLGPNDSGKSSFLDAIYGEINERIVPADFRRFGSDEFDASRRPHVELKTERERFTGDVELFKLPSAGIPMDSVGVADEGRKGAPPLDVSGANLAAFLDYLLRKDRARFDEIQRSLKERIPGLEGISIATPSPDRRAVTLTIDRGFEIDGARLSTGVRMMFFFVALAHHPNPPDLVLIEEPENGVHPKRLSDIVQLLRGMTAGKLSGHQTQIILTTHSPYLLDQIRLPQDQVIVFHREADGRRMASEADQSRLQAFLDEFMLGEVWFNQGEEGLLTASR